MEKRSLPLCPPQYISETIIGHLRENLQVEGKEQPYQHCGRHLPVLRSRALNTLIPPLGHRVFSFCCSQSFVLIFPYL